MPHTTIYAFAPCIPLGCAHHPCGTAASCPAIHLSTETVIHIHCRRCYWAVNQLGPHRHVLHPHTNGVDYGRPLYCLQDPEYRGCKLANVAEQRPAPEELPVLLCILISEKYWRYSSECGWMLFKLPGFIKYKTYIDSV